MYIKLEHFMTVLTRWMTHTIAMFVSPDKSVLLVYFLRLHNNLGQIIHEGRKSVKE